MSSPSYMWNYLFIICRSIAGQPATPTEPKSHHHHHFTFQAHHGGNLHICTPLFYLFDLQSSSVFSTIMDCHGRHQCFPSTLLSCRILIFFRPHLHSLASLTGSFVNAWASNKFSRLINIHHFILDRPAYTSSPLWFIILIIPVSCQPSRKLKASAITIPAEQGIKKMWKKKVPHTLYISVFIKLYLVMLSRAITFLITFLFTPFQESS